MNYIIFDLEATCLENHDPNFRNETIEIGAIKLDHNAEYVKAYDVIIRPKLNPILSDFCKELTSIEQEWVDNAELFPTVIQEFQDWIGSNYTLCSWGDYDRKQFANDCILHGLDYSWVEPHFNIKNDFARITNSKPMGMDKALMLANLTLDGIHHRGIDDAINIAKIFIKYFDEWRFP